MIFDFDVGGKLMILREIEDYICTLLWIKKQGNEEIKYFYAKSLPKYVSRLQIYLTYVLPILP